MASFAHKTLMFVKSPLNRTYIAQEMPKIYTYGKHRKIESGGNACPDVVRRWYAGTLIRCYADTLLRWFADRLIHCYADTRIRWNGVIEFLPEPGKT